MSDELKECPCGKEARFVQCAFGKWSVHCSSGECFSLEGEHRTKDQARDDWNRRQPEAKALTKAQVRELIVKGHRHYYDDDFVGDVYDATAEVIHAALPPVRPVVDYEARIAELEGLLATERSQALGFEKLYHREQGTTALLQADRDALVTAVKELRSDLFLQIEPKHGPKAASEYPSIVYANKVIASIKAGQPAKEGSN